MSGEYSNICEWLNSHQHGSMKDFEAGMSIVTAYLPDQIASMRVQRSDSKLYELLEKRLAVLDAKPVTKQEIKDPDPEPIFSLAVALKHPAISATQSDTVTQIPNGLNSFTRPTQKQTLSCSEAIAALEADNKLILKNQGHLQSQMSAIGRDRLGRPVHISPADKNKRRELRDQIVAYEADLRRNWHAIQHLQIYGTLPDEHPDQKKEKETTDAAPDYREMESNRKMISYLQGEIAKKKAKFATTTGPALLKLSKALAKQEENLEQRIKQRDLWSAAK